MSSIDFIDYKTQLNLSLTDPLLDGILFITKNVNDPCSNNIT